MNIKTLTTLTLCIGLSIGSMSCGKTLYNFAKNSERSKAGLTEKSIQVGDHKIVYLEGGKGETLLLVHGFGGDKDNWTRFAQQLEGRYHVVAPDLPGFGDSTRLDSSQYDINTQTKRLKDFAEAVNLKKFHIAGNSMGGWIAANYAVKYPKDLLTMTLMNAGGVNPPEKSDMVRMVEQGYNPLLVKDVKDYDRLMNFVFVDPPYVPGSIKKEFARKAVKHRAFNDKIFKDLREKSPSMEKYLPRITAPTLIIWGDTDRVLHVSSVGIFDRGIKNSKTYILENCGHLPMIERPEETAEVFVKFISGEL